jgi:hypothetical protein
MVDPTYSGFQPAVAFVVAMLWPKINVVAQSRKASVINRNLFIILS